MKLIRLYHILLLLALWCPQEALSQRFLAHTTYHNEAGKLIVSATLNGKSGQFLLDNGAPCAVTHRFAQDLSLKLQGQADSYDSNGLIQTDDVVWLDSIRLGGVRFTGLQALRLNQGNMIEQMGIDGIIGFNLFKMGAMMVDDREHMFVLASSSDAFRYVGVLDSLATPIKMTDDRHMTLIPIQVGEATDTVLVDLGDTDAYTMNTEAYQRLKTQKAGITTLGCGKGSLSMGAGGIEKATTKWRAKVDHLTIGNLHVQNVTSITNTGRESRIGTDLLHVATLIIDYPGGVCYLLPHNPDTIPDLYEEEWSTVITYQDGHLAAGMVWDANGSTLQGGERITSVGGQRFDTPIDLHQATTQGLIHMPGKEATITYIDSQTGQELKAKLIKR